MSKAIAYILNPEKTDEKLLVSSYGCASETAAREFEWTRKIAEQKGMNPVRIIARHVIQSFEIGEVTPELAHEIGKQFADEILGGKYEYVLTTHIDKDHVHNHLIFNAVDFVDYHAYKSYKRIYADLEKKVEDIHSSYDRTGKELKGVEARLREVQPLIKNISNYQRLKPVYDAFQKAKDKPSFKAKHEAELVIFEAARSTLLAMQGDEKLPSLKTQQAEQQRLLEEQQRLYDERAKLKKEARMIDTLKANVDDFLKPNTERDQEHQRNSQRE